MEYPYILAIFKTKLSIMISFCPVILSRLQFAANITFHILFPSITIGLAWILVFFRWRYNKTASPEWFKAYNLWVKIFALSFGFGVVSGITMSFQFGTNWPGFMKTVGNIAGPLLGYEVLTAFFLEATFLGIMLFGEKKVSKKVHLTATILVAIGTSLSAFWIMVLSSWMHTPIGFKMINGQAHALSWLSIIFNPSMLYRFFHMLIASGLTASFLVAGLSSYLYLRHRINHFCSLKTGVYSAAVLIPFQIIGGDLLGLNTLKHQPAKVAAMEGLWETTKGAPLVLFALPDTKNEKNRFSLKIPKLTSFILTHDFNGEVKGLKDFKGEAPPVGIVFWSFRIMVGVGFLMFFAALGSAFQIWRYNRLNSFFSKFLALMMFSGWVATISGWYVTEVGRQPYLVQGVLKTSDAVAGLPSSMVFTSFVIYILIYLIFIFFYLWTLFYLGKKTALFLTNNKSKEIYPCTT